MADETSASASPGLALGTRLWFAWLCFFRVLFDGSFASRIVLINDARGIRSRR